MATHIPQQQSRADELESLKRHRRERLSFPLVAIRTLGELMITAGLILLLFSAYEVWGKAVIVSNHQSDLDSALTQQWTDPSTPAPSTTEPGLPPPGGSIGRLFIPRLEKHWVIVEGIRQADLEFAPGHYPTTAAPGEIGNFAIAGHRSPAIFWDLDTMRAGDAIVMETQTTFFVYRVVQTRIVSPTSVEVVAPVPGHANAKPTVAMLTITTCNPKWDNFERLVVHAQLERSQPRSAGTPVEAKGA
jgi:sortase A